MSAPVVVETKFMRFEMEPQRKGRKTEQWSVSSRGDDKGPGGTMLGFVYWRPGWRAYVFEPECVVNFDARCLRDLAAFLEGRMVARKLK